MLSDIILPHSFQPVKGERGGEWSCCSTLTCASGWWSTPPSPASNGQRTRPGFHLLNSSAPLSSPTSLSPSSSSSSSPKPPHIQHHHRHHCLLCSASSQSSITSSSFSSPWPWPSAAPFPSHLTGSREVGDPMMGGRRLDRALAMGRWMVGDDGWDKVHEMQVMAGLGGDGRWGDDWWLAGRWRGQDSGGLGRRTTTRERTQRRRVGD